MEPTLNTRARQHGSTGRGPRGSNVVSPTHGIWMPAAHGEDLAALCRAVQLALPPDAVFTHLTAAQLGGWWIPDVGRLPLIACSDGDAPHLDRRGVYVRRCAIPPEHRRVLAGVRIASPEWTIIELAEHLALVDLVAVIDGALQLGHTSTAAIRATARRGRRGVRMLRQALDYCDGRSESRWETFLRLLHVFSDIPVEPQRLIQHDGQVIARADLGIVGTRRIAEYDGADHRDVHQHRRDLRRDKLLARADVERFGYTAIELLSQADQIIADADAALGRSHDPRRLARWQEEFERSSLSADGRAALRRRLHRFVRDNPPRRAPAA